MIYALFWPSTAKDDAMPRSQQLSRFVMVLEKVGNTITPYMATVYSDSIPENGLESSHVLPRPAQTIPKKESDSCRDPSRQL
jgi:hypothetical protein